MRDTRGPWYLLTGLILGFVGGLLYAWQFARSEYVNTSPASLRADFKDQYRSLIAAAFNANPNLERARDRLSLLKDEDMIGALALQGQRALAEGLSETEVYALGRLALSLQTGALPMSATPTATPTGLKQNLITASSPSLRSPTPVLMGTDAPPAPSATRPTLPTPSSTISGTLPATLTPTRTLTPTATRTPTPTVGAPFKLQAQTLVCDPDLGAPLVQVEVFDAANAPVPGVGFAIYWETNQSETFYTGLKPELGLGYADFTMIPGLTYRLEILQGDELVPDLTAPECQTSSGEQYWGSWRLTFTQR